MNLLSLILAEAPALLDPWLQAVIQLGCLGIVAFGSYYVLTRTIPSMQEIFLAELKEQRMLHNVTESAAREAFLQALSAQRADFKEIVKDYHASHDAMTQRVHELTQAVVSHTCPHLTGANPQTAR